MDLEIIILSKKEKDKYHDITYMWSLKYMTQMNLPSELSAETGKFPPLRAPIYLYFILVYLHCDILRYRGPEILSSKQR